MNRLSILMAATALGTGVVGGTAMAQDPADLLAADPCTALQALRDAPEAAGPLAALAPFLAEIEVAADDDACRGQLAAAAEAAGVALPDAAPAGQADAQPAAEPADEAPPAEIVEEAAPTDEVAEEAPVEQEAAEQPRADEAAEAPVEDGTSTEEAAPVEVAAPAETTEAPVEDAAPEEVPAEAAQSDAPGDGQAADVTEAAGEAPAPEQDASAAGTQAPETVEEVPAEAATDAAAVEVVQEDTAASTENANEVVATEAAQAEATENAEGDVTTEVVTEAETRRSDEEFSSRVTAAAPASGSSGGLSNFEKFALGALGVGVAAAILNNNTEVVAAGDDRAVVRREDGALYVLKDDNALLRQPGTEVQTQTFADGSVRQVTTRADGSQVTTIRAADGQVLRRTRRLPDGTQLVLFDDTIAAEPVRLDRLPEVSERRADLSDITDDDLRLALLRAENRDLGRRFTLQQIRNIRAVRSLVPVLEIEAITFDSGSAAVRASEAEELRALGIAMRDAIAASPGEVFLIEGHTDAVGAAAMNLALSDRRAESVALALTEYFDVPPENMVVQGYGESALKVVTPDAERANRRVTVRRITPLLYATAN